MTDALPTTALHFGPVHPADLTICRLITDRVMDPKGVQYAVRRHLERLRGYRLTPKPLHGPQTVYCPSPSAATRVRVKGSSHDQ